MSERDEINIQGETPEAETPRKRADTRHADERRGKRRSRALTKVVEAEIVEDGKPYSDKVERALDALCSADVTTIKQAAEIADLHPSWLSEMLKRPEVATALRAKLLQQNSTLHAVAAFKTLARLSQRAKSEYVQLEASKDVLDRAGFSTSPTGATGNVVNIQINLD